MNDVAQRIAAPDPEWQLDQVRKFVRRIADKWTLDVMSALWSMPLRPSELRRMVPNVAERVLLETLRRMTDRGLLARSEVCAEGGLVVYYELTTMARSLGEVLIVASTWESSLMGAGAVLTSSA